MKDYIAIILVLVIFLITILLIKFSENFRNRAYKLFLEAEHELGKGEKMDYVVEKIYSYLPLPLKILPPAVYKRWLQCLFDEIKDLLDDGKINNSKKENSK